jgi:hypothetical protein
LEQHESAAVSPCLQAAQQKLAQLRQAHRAAGSSPLPAADTNRPSPTTSSITSLPSHLGWGSAPLTTHLRRQANNANPINPAPNSLNPQSPIPNPQSPNPLIPASPLLENPKSKIQNPKSPSVRLYPDLALAILKQRAAAPGRIWLLLQHLDTTGQGWLPIATARHHLTREDSPLRVCGWRQLRALLAQGEAIYWQQNNGRIWLRSTAKVAATLGLTRLTAHPIALPIPILLGPIGQLRAHLYATFHSGRTPHPNQPARPIARATLNRLSGVSRRTQRTYERRARVRPQTNLAISHAAGTDQEQEIGWQHGRALFHFTDKKGKIGRPGATYLAWQLPNSYTGPRHLQPQPGRSRQKHINRELADLLTSGMTGNSKPTLEKRFYDQAATAARSYNRTPGRDHYWRNGSQHSRVQLWHHLPAQEKRQPPCSPI